MAAPTILILFEYGSLNGGEHSMLSVARRWDRRSSRLVAAVPPAGPLIDRVRAMGLAHVCWQPTGPDGRRRRRAEVLDQLAAVIEAARPDLVHANSLALSRLLGAARPTDRPCTGHLRDIMRLRPTAVADLNRLDGLAAVSQATAAAHIGQGLAPERVVVVPNGVDGERFVPAQPDPRWRRSWGLSDTDPVVAQIGQICLRKGQDVWARAAIPLARKFPALHTVFVGRRYSTKAESVAYERNLRACFEDAGLGQHAHWVGTQDDIPGLLNAVDLLVHSAHQEPLGRVLLEAAACAKPIVATAVGGTAEILSHGREALLVPPGDPGALAEAVAELLRDPIRAAEMGRRARQRVLGHFSIDRAAASLNTFWQRALS